MIFDSFEKNSIIICSDRVVLDSKEDSIFIISKKTVGISSVEQVHIDVGPLDKNNRSSEKNYFIVNAPKIQLGIPSEGKNEPVAKADSTIECLGRILDKLLEFSLQLKAAAGVGVGTVTLAQVNIASDKLFGEIKAIKDAYINPSNSPIKSKITNTI